MTRGLFVTGTDTGVGKTVLSALLTAALDGLYWKPIQTGAVEGTDRRTVMQLAEIPEDRTAPECYLFAPPVSPHLAAEAAGVKICLDRVRRGVPNGSRRLIVEGAGGILVPINESALMLDLARIFELPVVVASRTTLGTINHTLLTLRALRAGGVGVLGVVMIGPENVDNRRSIERYGGAPVIGEIPWLPAVNRTALLQVFNSSFDRSCFA